jgi:hypothetical protein
MRRSTLGLTLVVVVLGCGNGDRDPVGAGPDAPDECEPEGQHRCTGSSYEVCSGHLWVTETDCLAGCIDTLGCVACTPGQNFCKDGDVWSCDATGQAGAVVETCTGVMTCSGGACVDACATAASNRSYIGCEYWAVDLDNAVEVWGAIGEDLGQGITLSQQICTQAYRGTVATVDVCARTQGIKVYTAGACDPAALGGAPTCPTGYTCGARSSCISDAQHSPFAIVVSNPQTKAATVTLTGPGGETLTQMIPAGQVVPIVPQAGNAMSDASVDGTMLGRRAYKLVSDLPIVAYQFNPLDNVDVFSNDASLLIPRTAFDTDYFAMSYPTLNRRATLPGKNPYYGYLAIVAWQDGTQIEVTPTTAVQSSATQATIAAGATASFTLNAFDVLQLEAAPGAAPAGDLTGTRISSPNDTSYGVFGGHEATAFGETTPPDATHTRGPCCADHLEEMLFPASTWGKTFAIARSQQRTNEPDVLRILAQKPATTVTFDPPPVAGTCGTLDAGQMCEVKIAGDTELVATEPILVGHYLQSSTWQNTAQTEAVGTGDPSMAIAVPSEQFRKDYTVLVPAQYTKSYLSIAAAATGGVTVDGNPITLAAFPGGGTHRAARIEVAAGQHTVTCADGCGVTVYGYSDGVSYMFAGGLDLKPIVIL